MGINATRVVKFIRKGDKGNRGDDAIFLSIQPQTLVFHKGQFQRVKVLVDLYRGCTLVPHSDVVFSALASDGSNYVADGLRWGFGTENGHFYYSFIFTGSSDVNIEIPFTATYDDSIFPGKIMVQTIADGEKGDRGPALRGPQAWSDCATGYAFQCGAEGEAWKDVVLYGNNYYSCVKSHAKTADNYPGSTADQSNGYWQLGDKIELVATKILLASYALVKNLGVECIDMRDAAGNILFQAKDGNVVCRIGAFENISVSGDLTADSMNLRIATGGTDTNTIPDGSICCNTNGITLPELPEGTARSLRVLNPLHSRTSPGNLTLRPESANVLISKSLNESSAVSAAVVLSGCGNNSEIYMELIGVRHPGSEETYWLVSEMNNGIIS